MDAPWTEYHNTPNKSVRQNVARKGVVLHHAVMTNLDELIRLEMGAKQVSSTATCKDKRLPLMMPLDGFRAWSLSDSYWDSALRSVETCNQTMFPDYSVSDESHWSLAKAVAYWATIDGFWPHRDGNPKDWTVIGHREVYTIHEGSYATACPGGMDINLVVKRAQGILRGENGFLMALDDKQQADMYEWARQQAFGWSPDTLRSVLGGFASVQAQLTEIAKSVGADVDEKALAEQLKGLVTESLKQEIILAIANALPEDIATKDDVLSAIRSIKLGAVE